MLNKLTHRLGPTTRFLVGMAMLFVLLLLTVGLWWLVPLQPRETWTFPEPYFAVTFSQDGQTLATLHSSELILWDVSSKQQRKSIPYTPTWPMDYTFLWLSPDGQTAVVPTSPLKFWHSELDQGWVTLAESQEVLCFSADSKLLVMGSPIKVWDVATGKERNPDFFQEHLITSVVHPSDGAVLGVEINEDRSLTVWNLETQTRRHEIPAIDPPESSALASYPRGVLSTDGKRLAFFSRANPAIVLWDLVAGKELGPVEAPPNINIDRCQFSHDSRRLLLRSGSAGQLGSVWDTSTSPPRRLEGNPDWCESCSPDGKWLCAYESFGPTQGGIFHILDAATLQKQGTLARDAVVGSFAPDSKVMLGWVPVRSSFIHDLLGWKRSADEWQMWEVPSGRKLAAFPEWSDGTRPYFLDSGTLAVLHRNERIELWDFPPHRPWWIDYGLPVLFVVLLLLASWLVWRFFRWPGAGCRVPLAACPPVDQPPTESLADKPSVAP